MAVHWDAVPKTVILMISVDRRNWDKPYCMQLVLQSLLSTLASNKTLQDLEFLLITRFYSLRIVKNITPVIGKHNLIVDAVLASLASCLEATDEKYAVTTNVH